MRVSMGTVPLAAALAMACSGAAPEPGVLVVKVFVARGLNVDCLELSARNQAGAERTTRAAKKDGPLRVAVLRSAELSGNVTFVARGFIGPTCQEPLTPNGSSEPLVEGVPDFGSREVSIIVAGEDRDGDGYVASAAGGPDCNDQSKNARPGLAETCGDGLDNDCRGGADCADPSCASSCPGGTDGGFPYRPSNFEPAELPAPTGPFTLGCNDAFFDSTTLDAGWCGQQGPSPRIIDQDGGSPAVVLTFGDLLVDQGGVLKLTGSRPMATTRRASSWLKPAAAAASSSVASRPSSCWRWWAVLRSLVSTSIICTGMRMVRAWSAMARVMAWRIHHVA